MDKTFRQKTVLAAYKIVAGIVIHEILAHYIDQHTRSEREQELLEDFADTVVDAVYSMEFDE